MIALAGRLRVPAATRAILWDMDGVLLDTLGGDLQLARDSADAVMGESGWIEFAVIKRHFALEPLSFWARMLEDAGRTAERALVAALAEDYDGRRAAARFAPLPGIAEIVDAAHRAGIACAVASSNPQEVVDGILENTVLAGRFAAVVAIAGARRPKPAPDLYLQAAAALDRDPSVCVFVEDSLTGLQAGRAAGIGHAVAVATGGTPFEVLARSGLADIVYDRFQPPSFAFVQGAPTQKTLDTPNDFVSHMLEHIGWRLGVGLEAHWRNNDWHALGAAFGAAVRGLGFRPASSATLGMIDDGAAEVMIDFSAPAGLALSAHPAIGLERVLAQRVEQVDRGADLERLLAGLALGLGARIEARICSFEDPHHSWEGLYRALGICLARLRLPEAA